MQPGLSAAICEDVPAFLEPLPPVDIAGRYVGRFQMGYCETLIPPPSIIDFELTSVEEITGLPELSTGLRFHYDVRITAYQSDKIRTDCPPISSGVCRSNGEAACMLRGGEYFTQTALSYVYDSSFGDPTLTWCWDTEDPFIMGDLVDEAPGGMRGLSHYSEAWLTTCRPNDHACWNTRWREGIVENLSIGRCQGSCRLKRTTLPRPSCPRPAVSSVQG